MNSARESVSPSAAGSHRAKTARDTLVVEGESDQARAEQPAATAPPSAELLRTETGLALVDAATGSQVWTEPGGEGEFVPATLGVLRERDLACEHLEGGLE
ncbi:hypothetical protein [Streptomyces sp. MH13]|uniref:hypothetical protein n=1 Tax=unclassified Streptomyces TaxID=2593676 RepID=UPI003CE882AC